MKKSIFAQGSPIVLLIALIFSGFRSSSKQSGDIVLHDEAVPVTSKTFYIADVIDKRDDKSAVAWLIQATNSTNNTAKAVPVDLQGGCLFAVKQFISHNLPCNTALRPIVIGLQKFKVIETALGGGRVEGQVALVMSFDMQRGDETVHLIDYNGSAKYTRSTGPPQDIEPTLRHIIENSLLYFDKWMNLSADNSIIMAKTVTVAFTDHTNEKPEGDTIYYSASRPLTWDDFRSKVADSKFDAEIFPTIGYDEHTDVDKGIIRLTLDIKVCLPKSACWVKDGSRNDYTLNHEQRHFDIAKIVAERFKQKIKMEALPAHNFDGDINVAYLETYREMDRMQKQYDNETHHGADRIAQQQWNQKIDRELKTLIH